MLIYIDVVPSSQKDKHLQHCIIKTSKPLLNASKPLFNISKPILKDTQYSRTPL